MNSMRSLSAVLAWVFCAGITLAQQRNFDDVKIHVERVRGNLYLLAGAGGNITVQTGPEGVLVVDTEFAPLVPKILAEIRNLNAGPIRYIVNTHFHSDHVGGNAAIARALPPDPSQPLKIIAQSNVLRRLTQTAAGDEKFPEVGLPFDEYFKRSKDLHFNGEGIVIFHEPQAHTDGDSVVLFRGSDVISAGDVFTPGSYPFIDVDHGGSVNGEISALNHILHLTIPAKTEEGGTYVVPGHGRICDEADVVEFRDMVVIIRDRIGSMMQKGLTLEQIKAARPTRDYDPEYVSNNSLVTADRLVEAMYKSISANEKKVTK